MKFCTKHPKYKGKKAPKTQCVECLSVYTKLRGQRIPVPPPSKVFKDKSKYTRKDKHKKGLE